LSSKIAWEYTQHMTRETAYQMLTKYLKNDKLLKHSLAVEAVMQHLATRLNSDPMEWGITGLLHDADYDRTKGRPELHGKELFKLEPNSIPTNVEHAILAHNSEFTKTQPTTALDWALICCDELTLIVMKIASSSKSQTLAGITPTDILEKLRQKNFAKEAHKENIYQCETKLTIPLTEFVTICYTAMTQIHEQLGL